MEKQRAEAEWQLQDHYELLVLARANVVKIIREIRSVVRDPRNRSAAGRRGRTPYYTGPDEVIEALRGYFFLSYLHHPGRKNRIKPQVLLSRYESALAAVTRLEEGIVAAYDGNGEAPAR